MLYHFDLEKLAINCVKKYSQDLKILRFKEYLEKFRKNPEKIGKKSGKNPEKNLGKNSIILRSKPLIV